MRRRFFLGASLSQAALPAMGQEKLVRFSVTGALTQGSLALGSAPPGSLVALDGRPLRVTADGRFTFGFAPDQTRASLVTVRYPDGGGDSRSFTPTPRSVCRYLGRAAVSPSFRRSQDRWTSMVWSSP